MQRPWLILVSRYAATEVRYSQAPQVGVDVEHSNSVAQAEFAAILKDYVGRESPLYHAERLSERYRRCVLHSALLRGQTGESAFRSFPNHVCLQSLYIKSEACILLQARWITSRDLPQARGP